MRSRPPEFLHSLSLRKLRKELQDVCQEAMRLSRSQGTQRGDRDITLNFTSKDYIALQKRRDTIIDKIKTVWNMEEIK